jgi:DMSO/TMAO reductase YedYZ molybdopterin-dependent catalytic subunit
VHATVPAVPSLLPDEIIMLIREPAAIGERPWRRLTRRELLAMLPLAALTSIAIPSVRDPLLRRGVAATDRVGEWIFRPSQLAPTYEDADLTPFERFPINRYSDFEPTSADLARWRLNVDGLVSRPGDYTFERIAALPKVVQNVRHICIEGWDVIGNFGGTRMADLLTLVGADPRARFVEIGCLDDYYSSFDMASCQHPQTLACYEMYGRPLTSGHGAPLRMHMPVKLGYKSSKHVYSLRVTNVLRAEKGFWEDQGYSWHGGL